MLYLASIWVIPIIVAVTFHEAAHGFVARLLGDETAWRLGRVSFNPVKHIDPVGTILLPGFLLLLHSPFLFGYAKPVPINFRALRNPRRDMIWVAAAGPAMTSRSPFSPRLPSTSSITCRKRQFHGSQRISRTH
jgi:Zn-dependent protease